VARLRKMTCNLRHPRGLRHPVHVHIVGDMQHIHGMGWLRLAGSIKLQVSFAEYSLFYGALLQQKQMILSILLTEATPYCTVCCDVLHVQQVQTVAHIQHLDIVV